MHLDLVLIKMICWRAPAYVYFPSAKLQGVGPKEGSKSFSSEKFVIIKNFLEPCSSICRPNNSYSIKR